LSLPGNFRKKYLLLVKQVHLEKFSPLWRDTAQRALAGKVAFVFLKQPI